MAEDKVINKKKRREKEEEAGEVTRCLQVGGGAAVTACGRHLQHTEEPGHQRPGALKHTAPTARTTGGRPCTDTTVFRTRCECKVPTGCSYQHTCAELHN